MAGPEGPSCVLGGLGLGEVEFLGLFIGSRLDRLGLATVRCDDHEHVAAILLRRGLDEAQFSDILCQLPEKSQAQLE